MQEWLQRKLPSDAKDDMNRVQDFFQVAFEAMVLSLVAQVNNWSLDQPFPEIRRYPPLLRAAGFPPNLNSTSIVEAPIDNAPPPWKLCNL